MNNSIYRVCLDVHTTHSQTQLEISKGDNAREIEFTLTDGGAVYHIEGCTAIFRARKPDGTVLYNSCDVEEGKIKYQLTTQTSADVGILQCELELISDGKVLTSPRFTLRVADTVYDDSEIESEDEFTALTEALTKIQSGEGYITDEVFRIPISWSLINDKMFVTIKSVASPIMTPSNAKIVFTGLEAQADMTAYCDVGFYVSWVGLITVYHGTIQIDYTEGSDTATFAFKDNLIIAESRAISPTADTFNHLKGKTLVFGYPIGE